jgi:outer membrane receptor protein involved in Fe transport
LLLALAIFPPGLCLRAEPAATPAVDREAPRAVTAASPDETPVPLDKMVVTPSRFGIAEERVATNATLTNAELETLPQLGEDLYRTISRLPGLSSNELSAKFLVRGAPNSEMLARYDGVDLIEPFHLKDWDGALSIVDLQTIGSVDLVTGGFTTDYGDRLAGVMTLETQEFTRSQPLTTLGLSVTDMRATNQGTFAGGDGQWMVAARRGYIDLAVKLGGGKLDASPTYYDFSGKVEYRLSPQQTLSLHVLYAADTFQRRRRTTILISGAATTAPICGAAGRAGSASVCRAKPCSRFPSSTGIATATE